MRLFAFILFSLALSSCTGEKTVSIDDYNTRLVKLPRGQKVRVEVMGDPRDMARGMMFRDSLASDRGMLFLHREPGEYPYWMHDVRIPLDIVWMDPERRVVEIAPDSPPCKTESSLCPTYGGHHRAQYVLELAGGMAARYAIKFGDTLEF